MHFPRPSICVYFRTDNCNCKSQFLQPLLQTFECLCHQYIHMYKLRSSKEHINSSKEHINWLICHFHAEVLSNVQIFRGPLPAYVVSFFPLWLLAAQTPIKTCSKPCYFGSYQTLFSPVSFLIQLLCEILWHYCSDHLR